MENKEKFTQAMEILAKLDPIEFSKLFEDKKPKKSATQSEEIKELVSALSKAQGAMRPAVFNRVNPHFKNRYADFTSCMDSCREPLSNNGLSIIQYCETINDKLMLVTMLAHSSGQWMKSYFPLNPLKMDSQSIGSAMSYGKRYSLSALLGIVSDDEDDDAETAVGRGTSKINGHKVVDTLKTNKEDPQRAANFQSTQIQKMSPQQVGILKSIKDKLDNECIAKINKWLLSTYKTDAIEELPIDCFTKVLPAFENALKFMEQQKLEIAHA